MLSVIASVLVGGLALVAAQSAPTCPDANGLYYIGVTGYAYQVDCGVEYFTPTNLASQPAADLATCAYQCDSWNYNGGQPPCLAGSFDEINKLCFLKEALTGAQNSPDVVSLVGTKACYDMSPL